MSWDNDELERCHIVDSLIKLRMRCSIISALTGINHRPVRARWNALIGERPANGQLAESVKAYIKSPLQSAMLSSFVTVYESQDRSKTRVPNAPTLLAAWKIFQQITGTVAVDINAAWFAVRDVRAGIVHWSRCPKCQANHMHDPSSPHMRQCPYCAMIEHGEDALSPRRRRGKNQTEANEANMQIAA